MVIALKSFGFSFHFVTYDGWSPIENAVQCVLNIELLVYNSEGVSILKELVPVSVSIFVVGCIQTLG